MKVPVKRQHQKLVEARRSMKHLDRGREVFKRAEISAVKAAYLKEGALM